MSDPTAPGDGKDVVGDLSSTPVAWAASDSRPGGVSRTSALRSAEAPRGKKGTPGSTKPMITTVAPWALPSRTRTASGTEHRRAARVPSFTVPARPAAPTDDAPSDETRTRAATRDARSRLGDEQEKDTDASTSSASERSNAPFPPRAFLDHCPGLSDRDARLDVRHMTYGALFATARDTNTRIAVPTFQRAYRWPTRVAARFFRDVALRQGRGAARVKGTHGTGKCLFRRTRARLDREARRGTPDASRASSLLCLDGQQRCVTVALAVAAIRDAAERALARDLEETVARADAALFLDFDARDVDAGAAARAARRRAARTTISPSRADRAAFATCVGGGFSRPAASASEPATRDGVAATTATHFMVAAKRALDAEASRLPPASLADALEATLHEASLTYVEILGPDERVDLAQAFQWLQEKTLFAASAVLWNAAPGSAFAACDLARNYVLASTLNTPVEAQEEVHVTQWLEPLESRVRARRAPRAEETRTRVSPAEPPSRDAEETPHVSEHFDAFLRAFLDDDDARFAAARHPNETRARRACAVERDLRRVLASEHAPESAKRNAGPGTAMWTYARFRSFAERVAISTLGRDPDAFEGQLGDDDRETSGFRVDFTTSAPPPSAEGPAPPDDPADAAPETGPPGVRVRSLSAEKSGKSGRKTRASRDARAGSDPDPRRTGDTDVDARSRDALTIPPVPFDDAARREVVARLVAFGERAGFLALPAVADRAGGERREGTRA